MAPKKQLKKLSFTEREDPMIAPVERKYTEQVFFEKWQECLDDSKGWNFSEMKKRLDSKPAEQTWYVIKSVETFPAEDDSVPFVPNFIIFSHEADPDARVTPQAPRLCMRAAKKTPDMDEEAFMTEDIVDMKGSQEWRALEGHDNVYVLCNVSEDTTAIKALGFGAGQGGFLPVEDTKKRAREEDSDDKDAKKQKTEERENKFSFNSTSTPNFSGNFGAPAAPAGNFGAPAGNFGAPAASGFDFSTPSTGFDFGAPATSGPTAHIDETVYPVLWTPEIIEDTRKEISAGMKIIAMYETEGFKLKVKIDCDLEFAKKLKEAKHVPIIRALIEKKVLEASDEFKALKEEYQGDNVAYDGVEEHERMQAEFKKKRSALLAGDELKKQVKSYEKEHMSGIVSFLRPIVKARIERIDDFRSMLTAINKETKEKRMLDRSAVHVIRMLPEKDSKGAHCAFRPCKKINKAIGAADECYPEEQVQINPLTGLPMPTNFV
eukprot:TRINITY_DN4540_c1_g1_i1.p1 TRINITY_DN4540_c1_g1~~TRINITY_DN4540_c1_g1_i1.p1  ORF type:complete len:491 (+),score=154.27 TRINITY_DN4540_c1_g1_i1:220-1692(+)